MFDGTYAIRNSTFDHVRRYNFGSTHRGHRVNTAIAAGAGSRFQRRCRHKSVPARRRPGSHWQVFVHRFTPPAIVDPKYTRFRHAFQMAQVLLDRCLPIRKKMVRVQFIGHVKVGTGGRAMWLSRLGTLSITAIQGALAADAMEDHSLVRLELKIREVVVQFEPQAPITALELRNGIVRVPLQVEHVNVGRTS